MTSPAPYALGWTVRLRKPHPCGGADWEITRLGADIGLKCLTCQRRVLMPRSALDKRMKTVVSCAGSLAKSHIPSP